jgi:hypothetical protein
MSVLKYSVSVPCRLSATRCPSNHLGAVAEDSHERKVKFKGAGRGGPAAHLGGAE